MTEETRARFLASIAKELPAERVIEVHLFGAIRQGGMESGVAVVALALEAPTAVASTSFDVDGGYVPPPAVAEAAELESRSAVAVHDQLADEAAFVADEVSPEDPDSPYAPEPQPEPRFEAEPEFVSPAAPASRFTVYSARYRHTLKGLDRGKWEVNVTEQADAPLLTVDAVVRGVQRRSGDADEVVRLSGDEFRAALPTA
ncbi:MAG: hypothetical protein M3Z05_19030 [Gemmatimonadota bacterium]|nr:hypothetical protein [Gemmatimonadota bacterium]